MFGGTYESPLGTLKEDAYMVFDKCKYILGGSCYSNSAQKLLKWDFAGPFFISVLFPLTVYFPRATYEVERQNEACVALFLFIWILPFLCGINASLLGSFV
ncbi:hypothetical protein BEWA_044900 [Theileria equi strain WA]|uniref:Uncharacterized protein n=1 Tax=Theileria equi strain WA TaxID=1537102 RepID=L1LGM4_THEEQ|nr:hypothetical protein BEWA_044900 [Theileria equi strain WA]EKX74410.1 hypothetical protein BEWA_044900 [Theileria equi strain WA]|eukprot:XP_004833862.1 hypothetical protein BEWA_044900 [Theileria equi strain WA]